MAEVNYKTKYTELKAKFMNSIDTAFRMGMEQGMQQAQVQQAAQQQADAQAMQQAAMGGQDDGSGGMPGEGGDPGQPGQDAGPPSEHPEGSELDQHISQLESAMGKTEKGTEAYASLKKSLDGFRAVKASFEHAAMLRKNDAAVRAISYNMNKIKMPPVRTMNDRARKNLSEQQKSTLNMQQKIVDDCFKHWDAEETDMMSKVLEIVSAEGKSKKE